MAGTELWISERNRGRDDHCWFVGRWDAADEGDDQEEPDSERYGPYPSPAYAQYEMRRIAVDLRKYGYEVEILDQEPQPTEKDMTAANTRTAANIAAEIRGWDLDDIRNLRDLLSELSEALQEEDIQDPRAVGIDMAALPSAEIPADIDTGYPVWAVDLSGYALVGPGADEIESLDAIRAGK